MNKKKTKVSHRKSSNEKNFIHRQLKSLENDLFQSDINQFLVIFKYRYCQHQTSISTITSEICLNTNKPQQQMVLHL
jgi:hypothetical protein